MNYFQSHANFYNTPIRLSEEEKTEPLAILQSFFQNCPLSDVRQLLWHMIETSLAVPDSVFDSASERQTLLWFYRELETALEAGWILCEKRAKKEQLTKTPAPTKQQKN